MKRRRWLGPVLTAVLFSVLACVVPAGQQAAAPTSAPIAASTSTKTPIPPTATVTPTLTPLPMPTNTPMPTARPLIESEAQEGEYINDLQGISLEYPRSWEVLEENNGQSLLVLGSENYSVYIFVFSDYLPSDTSLDEYSGSTLDSFIESSGTIAVNNIEYDLEYEFPSGLEAWYGRGDGTSEGFAVKVELLMVPHGSRLFGIFLYSYSDYSRPYLGETQGIVNSLEVYTPHPYGVDRSNALFLPGYEPDSYDPAKWPGSADSLIGDIFSGLVRLDTSLQPIPDLAYDWDISKDGTVYTFYLHEDAQFHDGRPFTAEDVVFSWEHALDPETESFTAVTYLGDIVGVEEYANGEADSIAGVKIIDDYTLEVTLDAAKVYFLSKLSYPVSWIVDRNTIDDIDDNDGEINGTGPFRVVRHDENAILILERNPVYYLHPVSLEYVVYTYLPAPSMQLYETGDIDIVGIDRDFLDRAEDPGDPLYGNVHEASQLCTDYLVFNSSKPPFDDPAVRRAFAQAIDRDQYNEVFLDGEGILANGLFPPGLPGYNPDVRPLGYDIDAALQALEDSTYGSADALPPISLTTTTVGGDISQSTAFFIEAWQDGLGVSVGIDAVDSESIREALYDGEYANMVFWGWCADYADPENFADLLFHSSREQNIGMYSNSDVDALLEQARSIESVEERMALYQEIEQMLVDDAAAAFLTHSEAYYVVTREGLLGYEAVPIGVAQNMNLSFEGQEP